MYHVGGGSLPQGNPRKLYLNFRNNLIMLYKNLHFGEQWIILTQRHVLDFMAAVKSLVSGKPKDMAAIFRAYRDYYRWRRTEEKNTGNTLPRKRLFDLNGVFHGIMIWRYYFLNKRTFSTLWHPKKK